MKATKSQNRFFIISLKKQIVPILLVFFTICLVVFSKQNITAAKAGLSLWANSVVPSLLPFFIATELLTHTDIITTIGRFFNRFMRPIFNVPGEGGFALIMGMISGYPVGAKIATNFRKEGICSKSEAERLLAFTNNSGPLFIIGTVGVTMFGDTTTGILLLVTHILACLSVGFLFRFWGRKETNTISYSSQKTITKSSSNITGQVLGASIMNSINTVIMIGGFVVLFSVIISILDNTQLLDLVSHIVKPAFTTFGIDSNFCQPFLSGIIELTNGVKNISMVTCKNFSINVILCSFLLGFSGISIVLQVYSIIAESDISIKPYLIGKFLQGCFAAFYTYLILSNFTFLSLDIQPAISPNTTNFYTNPNFIMFASIVLLIIFALFKIQHSYKKRAGNY